MIWWEKPTVFTQLDEDRLPDITDEMADIEVREEGRIIPGSWRKDVNTAERMISVAVIRSNNYEQATSAVRDRYAEQFSSSDVVP
jgi:hypothetical protein